MVLGVVEGAAGGRGGRGRGTRGGDRERGTGQPAQSAAFGGTPCGWSTAPSAPLLRPVQVARPAHAPPVVSLVQQAVDQHKDGGVLRAVPAARRPPAAALAGAGAAGVDALAPCRASTAAGVGRRCRRRRVCCNRHGVKCCTLCLQPLLPLLLARQVWGVVFEPPPLAQLHTLPAAHRRRLPAVGARRGGRRKAPAAATVLTIHKGTLVFCTSGMIEGEGQGVQLSRQCVMRCRQGFVAAACVLGVLGGRRSRWTAWQAHNWTRRLQQRAPAPASRPARLPTRAAAAAAAAGPNLEAAPWRPRHKALGV